MPELIVYRSNALMSIRSRFDATRDLVMPANLAYAEAMVGMWHSGLPQVSIVASTATDAQVWPVMSAVGTRIHDTSDDNCPINTGWSYVGGNHGYNVGTQIAVTNHGKTTADVGSRWTDGVRIFTLLAVTSPGSLLFGNPYTVVDGIAQGIRVRPAAPLTHVAGATNRTTVPVTAVTPDVQIRPATHSHTVAVELDGRPVRDGRSTGQELQIRESYVIPSYRGMIDTAQANVGTPIATIMNRIPSLCRVHNVYRWVTGGLLVSQTVTALSRFTLNAGVTQCAPLTAPAGGNRRQFMPNVGYTGGLSWSAWAAIDTLTALTDFTPATLREPATPAASMTQWALSSGNIQQWGIAVGLLPIDDGHPGVRSRHTTVKGWFISSSLKKNYPQLVWGRTMAAGESVTGTAYRRYLAPYSAATEIVVSAGGRDFVMIERVGTVTQARMAVPQLYHRLLVPAGPTNLAVADRVAADGVTYSVPVSPGYGMWQAVGQPGREPLPGSTDTVGSYFLPLAGATRSTGWAGAFQRLLLYPVHLAEATPVDRVCVEVTAAGSGVLRHGVYAHDPVTGRPALRSPIADFGTVAVAPVGVRESVRATPVTLPAGWHWYAVVWQASGVTPPALRTSDAGSATTLALGTVAAAMSGDRYGYDMVGVSGPLGPVTLAGVHQHPPPRLAYRRA
ncbi:hypothetical protein O7608_19115 [Solwaraspora sp. WMMA2056]|uniref:hypothetical protein n=1 Tax=Solwaraspora sp. WMMA2056 TaxID=3015161 RepID=UPI00259BC251|nr:hypothetical protein [Solwaraspora sp. WMMA2056]WJK38608.1 hypothetical protein O7608_19115 [Solwaraspora sp. WMMA2056]